MTPKKLACNSSVREMSLWFVPIRDLVCVQAGRRVRQVLLRLGLLGVGLREEPSGLIPQIDSSRQSGGRSCDRF